MTRSLLLLCLVTAPALADDEPDGPRVKCVDLMRKAYEAGDYETAKINAEKCYQLEPNPKLLFALGQIEFNLHHYKEALAYYEKFVATNPPADQMALVQQAIGAARAELDRPPPPPPPPPPQPAKPLPPPHRQWDTIDTALAVTGGVLLAGSGYLFFETGHLADDRSGSLSAYSRRIDRAYLARNVGFGTAAGGAIALGAALIRWRFHLVESVTVEASPTGATASLVRSW